MNNKVLLHICCGTCAAYAIEKLKSEQFQVFGYFYNPNVYPYSEYLRREKTTKKISQHYRIDLFKSKYDTAKWRKKCEKIKFEKEGGSRCLACFRLRLEQTKRKAKSKKFDYFTTTLTISPHKSSQEIFEIGARTGGDQFLKIDFKKKDGFKKTIDTAKKLELYRQNYCGCKASKKI